MAWIKSDQSLANHPKLILLARELGITKVKALGRIYWYWTLEYADDGELKYLDLIPDACEWEDDAQKFIEALIKYEFIDQIGEKYVIHDWLDYSGAFYEKKLYNRIKNKNLGKKFNKNRQN